MNKAILLIIAALGGFSIFAIGCKSDPVVVAPPKPLVILAPKGGEAYKVNQTVQVQWQINDKTKIGSVQIDLSLNRGKSFPITLANHSFPTDTTEYAWKIDTSYHSDSCIMRVKEYNTTSINDLSGVFSISK
jgi:hypothetical protein